MTTAQEIEDLIGCAQCWASDEDCTDSDVEFKPDTLALLRAAPDLLAALKQAQATIAVLKTFCPVPRTVVGAAETEHAIEAAIAKARSSE